MLLRQEHRQIEIRSRLPSFKMLALTLAVLIPINSAWSQETPPDFDVIETTLEEATSKEEGARLKLQVSDKVTYEITAEPNVDLMRSYLGLSHQPTINPLAEYQALSEEDQKKFQERRLEFLKNAANMLNSTKFALGMGSLVGRSFMFMKEKVQKLRGKSVPSIHEKLSFKNRSHKTTENILQGLDYKLWSQAPLLIASNEFGVSFSAGLVVEQGYKEKGWGGSEELGFNLGFNKESKAFVFEIFYNSERIKKAHVPMALFAVPVKIGVFMGHRSAGHEPSSLRGDSFYPPTIPGYSSLGPEYFVGGLNTSFGFPPSPFCDLMTYTNRFSRTTLLRITISPLVTGYVRMQVGGLKETWTLVTAPVTQVFKFMTARARGAKALSCASVFN